MKNKALLQTNTKTKALQLLIVLAVILIIVSLIGCDDEQSNVLPKEEGANHQTSIPSSPKLLFPANGSTLDNGCLDRSDPIGWEFEWESVPNAQAYQLFAIGANATYPIIDESSLLNTTYHYSCTGCYIAPYHSKGWTWKVRALVNDEWLDWSERKFDVEDVDTDCK